MRVAKILVELFALRRKFAQKHNGIYRFWSYPRSVVNIYTPEDIEAVISSPKHNMKGPMYSFLKPWLWDGLLLSSGLKWHQRRKILTPAFHFNILRQFLTIMEENCSRMLNALEATEGKATDVISLLSEYTLNSICETAMGTQLSKGDTSAARCYKDSIYKLGKLLIQRISRIYYNFDLIYNLSSLGREQKECLDTVRNFTEKVIEDRKRYIKDHEGTDSEEVKAEDDTFMTKKKKKVAMLDLLILAKKDGHIDDVGIQEEVETFMFEGHDTTAGGLTFTLLLLAEHKQIQDKVYKEQEVIFEGSQRPSEIEDLSKMKYLECVIKESLRLYPPVPVISRTIGETLKLSNYTIPKGTMCNIHIYDLHRREVLFNDPLRFDPDRFLPENSVGRHPYAYIPFSAGPRNCIGQKFAMIEMKSALSGILRRFELEPVTRQADVVIPADLVLRTTQPVYINFKKRHTSL
ncbi:cytochrome P450 4C1-like isoform X1 [Plodia interpunctella]|uniref:cytochrome P450 4C1-like isoform X1 n=1 Tax=Plodia interpunctella TaxID=58824 RepID=UPI002367FACF|nr:cytochrome P450 4C1-like isoform X1 [Plodia interpunctella]